MHIESTYIPQTKKNPQAKKQALLSVGSGRQYILWNETLTSHCYPKTWSYKCDSTHNRYKYAILYDGGFFRS